MVSTRRDSPPAVQPVRHAAGLASLVRSAWLGNAALVLLGVALGLTGIEVAVRLWVATVKSNLLVLDDELGWIQRPHLHQTYRTDGVTALINTNELGFRGPLPTGPPTHARILVLGDSFAFGREVSDDDLFSTIWQRERPDLEIVNAGVRGYGTVQEMLLLRRLEPIVRPDVVLLMVYENDLTDNVMPFATAIGPRPYVGVHGHLHPSNWRLFHPILLPVPGAEWLHRHSLAAYLLHFKILFVEREARIGSFEHWERTIPERTKWKVLEELVATLATGRRLVVAALPTREDVVSGNTGFSMHLAAVAAGAGAEFVDLQPVLAAEDFCSGDPHWNASGHRAVAHLAAALPLRSDPSRQ